jgi:hypothetical protein
MGPQYIAVGDGFRSALEWEGLMPGADRFIMDIHPYVAFDEGSRADPIDVAAPDGEMGGIWPGLACERWGTYFNETYVFSPQYWERLLMQLQPPTPRCYRRWRVLWCCQRLWSLHACRRRRLTTLSMCSLQRLGELDTSDQGRPLQLYPRQL